MSPDILEYVAPLIAILGVGSFVLIGMKLRLDHKVRLQAGKREDNDQLTDAIDALSDEVRMMRGDIGDLQERMDFAERLLTKGPEHRPFENPANTPS